MRFERSALMEKFRGMVARGEPIVGGGAGTGLSAKCEEAGGIDLIVIYNSGRYRMAGRGSLAGLMAYGDANAIVMEMAAEVLPVVKKTPVLAGVNGTDPFRQMDVFLDEVKRVGFSGVQNFPTVGIIDGTFRANLEETGMSYGLEVDMIAKAHAKDMLTTPYVFNEDEAAAMAKAGADIIVCHMGLTTGGSIGAGTALKLADCPALVDKWSEAALKVRRDVLVLVHGGPVAEPADAEFVLKNTKNCHGFYGASSMERLPVEVALTEQTRKFKADRPALAGNETAGSRPARGGRHVRRAHWATDPVADHRGHRHRDHRLPGELALSPVLEGGVLRAHRSVRRAGGDQRRRLRAAVHPRLHAGEHERAADGDRAREGGRADHQGPHARRHRGRVLRAREAH